MELWIARYEDGRLALFHECPTYNYIRAINDYDWQFGDIIGTIDKTLFPEITFENSPRKIKIELL